ncbi:LacI family DNA-binding transcriptional regulator [Cellvibrio polysaccharolyticus]|uniref:LacI family DNA-binding transcriptional regulator n=1 Tax=Cellvibrio polysaccharolyticus TaxID=2082724 RepID=A0A928YWH0_9GAMM|nr:LacI family DNA-binding transcriptional regulator [Cellvibrio polysaccharolyticus]MBE8718198.1 LacI family DNA-binding transcriptional regulator [Cellvibrio polysaccharolyticus]
MAKTIEEIASELSVSTTTVSLALSGKARQYRISMATEERIKAYAEEHGYQINHTARSLRLQRTDTMALIVPRLSNHFFASLAEKLEIRCRDAGIQLFVSCCYDNPDTQLQLIQNFRQRNIDGLFVVPSNPQIPEKANRFFKHRMVLLDRDFGLRDFPVIITDNKNASISLTEKILANNAKAAGETEILFLAGNPDMPSIKARISGFETALKGKKIPEKNIRIVTVPRNGFNEGTEGMQAALAAKKAIPDILLTSSIPVFEGALHALKQQIGEVPATMMLATFDDHTMLDFLPNPVCSAKQDSDHMIRAAYDEMEKLIKNIHAPQTHIASLKIIARNMV